MKKIMTIIAICLLAGAVNTYAQITKEQRQERKEMLKMTKAELNQKASKDARKEAKRLKKEGWKVAPGALPMEKQLDRVFVMKYEFDTDMFPKWIFGDAMSIGENFDAAKMQAIAIAKEKIAGEIGTEVTAIIDNNLGNKQLSPEEAASLVKSIDKGKQFISRNIGRTITVTEMYRTLSNKNKEVRVQIAYSSEMARQNAKQVIRDELEKEGDDLGKKLDELLGW
ncbi:MAG: hypothetical protein IJ199_00910 [Prevotella sp.]|nr:hypothetical protein [Prevotella sp.]